MSQSPVYAACDEHASESSDTTSSNTSQEHSMETNIEVPSLSDDNKGSHFPFMRLPVGKSTVTYAASITSELISQRHPYRDSARDLPVPPNSGPTSA